MSQNITNKEIGYKKEAIATEFLKNKGFLILKSNYIFHHCEIDIIAQKGDCIHFIEVNGSIKKVHSDWSRYYIDITFEELKWMIANGKKHFYRLDMGKIQIRNKVRAIKSNDELDAIFEEYGERKI